MTGMFDLMISLLNPINVEYYCGDAQVEKEILVVVIYILQITAIYCLRHPKRFLKIQNRH